MYSYFRIPELNIMSISKAFDKYWHRVWKDLINLHSHQQCLSSLFNSTVISILFRQSTGLYEQFWSMSSDMYLKNSESMPYESTHAPLFFFSFIFLLSRWASNYIFASWDPGEPPPHFFVEETGKCRGYLVECAQTSSTDTYVFSLLVLQTRSLWVLPHIFT